MESFSYIFIFIYFALFHSAHFILSLWTKSSRQISAEEKKSEQAHVLMWNDFKRGWRGNDNIFTYILVFDVDRFDKKNSLITIVELNSASFFCQLMVLYFLSLSLTLSHSEAVLSQYECGICLVWNFCRICWFFFPSFSTRLSFLLRPEIGKRKY